MRTSKNRVLGVSFLALLMVSSAWAVTPVEEESFAVTLPDGFSKFAKKQQTVKSESGDIQQVTFVSTAPDGDAVIVTYGEMSGKILDPQATMKSGRDSLINSLRANLASERELEIDGNPALSISFSAEKPRPIFARTDLVVAGPRMYQVIYLGGTQEDLTSVATEMFFSSFDIDEAAIEAAEARLAAEAAAKAAAETETPAATTTEAMKTAEKIASEQ